MRNIIILCFCVVIGYLGYYFRYHLRYYFSLVSVTLKNKKSLENFKKKGLNKRKIDNKKIQEYLNISLEKISEENLYFNNEFFLDKELERKLIYSRFSDKYVEELFDQILKHYNIKREEVELYIEHMSSRKTYGFVGRYLEKNENQNPKVEVYIKNDTSLERIISVIAHECTHHLLLSNGIRLENRIDNECMTDIVTALNGFGKYMVKGYEISNRVTYDEEFMRYVNKDTVGYLSSADIKYLIKIIKKGK